MDPRFKKSLKISTVIHAVVILVLLLGPLIANWWFRRQRPKPMIIDLTLALPDIPAAAVADAVQAPDPTKDIPAEPPKPKHQVQKSEKRITRTPPKPDQPNLSQEEIRRLLAAGAKIGDRTSASAEFPEAWYFALVRQTMYEAWNQPGSTVPVGTTAEVMVRVEKDGAITRRTMTRSSGHPLMDASVMKAVQAVARLRPLPAQWNEPHRDITIEFELAAGAVGP